MGASSEKTGELGVAGAEPFRSRWHICGEREVAEIDLGPTVQPTRV
jgi:hypothetical protein